MISSAVTEGIIHSVTAEIAQVAVQIDVNKTDEKNQTLNQYICEKCGKKFHSNFDYERHKSQFTVQHKYFKCCSKIVKFGNTHKCKKTQLKRNALKNNYLQLTVETGIERKEEFVSDDDNDVGDDVEDEDEDDNELNDNYDDADGHYTAIPKENNKNKTFKKKPINHRDIKYKIYKCQECLQLFTKYINLSQHLKIIHHKHGKFKCSICDEDFSANDDFKAHMQTHGPEDKIICKGCKKTFDTLKLYYIHAKQNPGMHCYICKLCLRQFPTELMLDQHVCICQNGKPLHCACGKEFTKYKDVIEHSKGTRPFSCCTCPHLANSLTAYIRHLRKHSKQKPYHCEKCDMKFAVIDFLNIHNKKLHSENNSVFFKEQNSDLNIQEEHICNFCNDKFNTAAKLNEHYVTFHEQKSAPEDERAQCPDCGKLLKRNRLENHRNTHKTSASLCPECGKLFDTRFKLTQHIITAHNNEPVKCEVCMKVLKTKKILNEHMKTHLKSELGGRIPQAICPMCGLGLAQKGSLARHILLTHEKHKVTPCNKTYTCQECSIVLPNRAKYYSHRRMHRAMVDRFPCEVCGREFNKKQNLKRHMYLLHDETRVLAEPIFKCQFCTRCFREKKNLKRHYKMVHKVEDIV